jgi:hypothetical protein
MCSEDDEVYEYRLEYNIDDVWVDAASAQSLDLITVLGALFAQGPSVVAQARVSARRISSWRVVAQKS